MRSGRLLLVLPLLVSTALAAPPQNFNKRGTPVDPLARYTWLGELAGSCWAGTTEDGKPADTQCYSTQYGNFLRGTIKLQVPRGDKVVDLEGDSVLAWDPVTGNIEIFYWSSDGTFRRGEATLYKGKYRFQDRTRDGSPPVRRTIWRRQGPDSFEVTLERRDGDRWVDVKVVTYERVKPRPP
jgi:hypothetical protein